jgi:predicted  nucleic acid-binding Zn-ribbon protein
VENAETTYARLKVELEQRQNDLEKIKTLEGRIEKEMQQVTEKIGQMEDEMANKFTRTDELKVDFDREKVRLAHIRAFLAQYKPGLQKQMTYHSMKHDTKKNQIL